VAQSLALNLLGRVLWRARETLDRSPEQVGSVVGVSGRTIRRLEENTGGRPRRVTIESLAAFYGLNEDFLVELAAGFELCDEEVERTLMESAGHLLGPEVADALAGDFEELAARLSRAAGTTARVAVPMGIGRTHLTAFLHGAAPHERDEAFELLAGYVALDQTRRRMVRELMFDLRRAQQAARHGLVLDPDSGD
jgi:transcriptional regulator with XRE-family HTH domain